MSDQPITEIIPIYIDADERMRISGTRVLLDLVVYAYQQGSTPETIVQKYPALTLEKVYLAIGYYLRHRDEVDAYIQQVDEEAERIRERVERDFPRSVTHEELLARLEAKKKSQT